MKFSAIFAAAAAAAVANAQGYNQTMSISKAYDARTVSVPAPSYPAPTAYTSLYTITSSCGTIQVYRPGTSVFPLSGSGAVSIPTKSATHSHSHSGSTTASGSAGASGSATLVTVSGTGAASMPTAMAGMGAAAMAGVAAVLML